MSEQVKSLISFDPVNPDLVSIRDKSRYRKDELPDTIEQYTSEYSERLKSYLKDINTLVERVSNEFVGLVAVGSGEEVRSISSEIIANGIITSIIEEVTGRDFDFSSDFATYMQEKLKTLWNLQVDAFRWISDETNIEALKDSIVVEGDIEVVEPGSTYYTPVAPVIIFDSIRDYAQVRYRINRKKVSEEEFGTRLSDVQHEYGAVIYRNGMPLIIINKGAIVNYIKASKGPEFLILASIWNRVDEAVQPKLSSTVKHEADHVITDVFLSYRVKLIGLSVREVYERFSELRRNIDESDENVSNVKKSLLRDIYHEAYRAYVRERAVPRAINEFVSKMPEIKDVDHMYRIKRDLVEFYKFQDVSSDNSVASRLILNIERYISAHVGWTFLVNISLRVPAQERYNKFIENLDIPYDILIKCGWQLDEIQMFYRYIPPERWHVVLNRIISSSPKPIIMDAYNKRVQMVDIDDKTGKYTVKTVHSIDAERRLLNPVDKMRADIRKEALEEELFVMTVLRDILSRDTTPTYIQSMLGNTNLIQAVREVLQAINGEDNESDERDQLELVIDWLNTNGYIDKIKREIDARNVEKIERKAMLEDLNRPFKTAEGWIEVCRKSPLEHEYPNEFLEKILSDLKESYPDADLISAIDAWRVIRRYRIQSENSFGDSKIDYNTYRVFKAFVSRFKLTERFNI